MLFNSLPFLVFLLLVLAVVRGLRGSWTARKRFLLGASWFFYATWSPRFLALLVATTWVDFHLACWLYRARWGGGSPDGRTGSARARAMLIASIAINLGVLASFKYGRFLWDSAATLLPLSPPPAVLSVAVPLGISFYTFLSISYVVDT